jgi:hypothetical protein
MQSAGSNTYLDNLLSTTKAIESGDVNYFTRVGTGLPGTPNVIKQITDLVDNGPKTRAEALDAIGQLQKNLRPFSDALGWNDRTFPTLDYLGREQIVPPGQRISRMAGYETTALRNTADQAERALKVLTQKKVFLPASKLSEESLLRGDEKAALKSLQEVASSGDTEAIAAATAGIEEAQKLKKVVGGDNRPLANTLYQAIRGVKWSTWLAERDLADLQENATSKRFHTKLLSEAEKINLATKKEIRIFLEDPTSAQAQAIVSKYPQAQKIFARLEAIQKETSAAAKEPPVEELPNNRP